MPSSKEYIKGINTPLGNIKDLLREQCEAELVFDMSCCRVQLRVFSPCTITINWTSQEAYIDTVKISEILRQLACNDCMRIKIIPCPDNCSIQASVAQGVSHSIDPHIENMRKAIYDAVIDAFNRDCDEEEKEREIEEPPNNGSPPPPPPPFDICCW